MTIFLVPGPLNGIAPLRRRSLFTEDIPSEHTSQDRSSEQVNDESHFFAKIPSRVPKRIANKVTSKFEEQENSDATPQPLDLKSEEFEKHILGLRDEALRMVRERKAELLRWDQGAKNRMTKWFGGADEQFRQKLMTGLDSMVTVLMQLKKESFLQHSAESSVKVGCTDFVDPNAVASACAADVDEHRIQINPKFFSLPIHGYQKGSKEYSGKDSQLMTLIHEVTHFENTFGSGDVYYSATASLVMAKQPAARANADSIAAYIMGMSIELPAGLRDRY